MSSTYAPLPFSYLAPGGAQPRVGLRKEGVYGTSADVPVIYEESGRVEAGFSENPYTIYSNSPAANGQAIPRPNQSNQPYGLAPRAQESPYDIRQRPDPQQDRQLKSGPGYSGYHIPEADYVQADRIPERENPGAKANGAGFSGHQESRGNGPQQERIQSYYPPRDASRRTPDFDNTPRTQNEVAPSTYENFILVKDPNRVDQPALPGGHPSAQDPGRSRLEAMFEDKGPTDIPRNNINSPPPVINQTKNGDARTRPDSEEVSYTSYSGIHATEEQQLSKDRPKEAARNIYSDMNALPAKSRERNQSCCRCSTCSAVLIAIIITAVICLGAGFVAGWFGALADRQNSIANQSTITIPIYNSSESARSSTSTSTRTTTTTTTTTITPTTTTTSRVPSTSTTTTTTTTTKPSVASTTKAGTTSASQVVG